MKCQAFTFIVIKSQGKLIKNFDPSRGCFYQPHTLVYAANTSLHQFTMFASNKLTACLMIHAFMASYKLANR